MGDMAGMANLVIAFCADDVDSARVARAVCELELAATSLEAVRSRERDADIVLEPLYRAVFCEPDLVHADGVSVEELASL